MANDLISHASVKQPLQKPERMDLDSSRLVNIQRRFEESGLPGESMEVLHPFPNTLLYSSLPSGCSELYCFIINQQSSK